MYYFPQLSSGAVGQYPLLRREVRRVVRKEMLDGREWKASDGALREISWLLRYRGLSTEEYKELEGLFDAVEGRLGEFVFLDPADNLLVWSGDLEREAWTRDPYLEVISGVEDPFGGATGVVLRNGCDAPQAIEQLLLVPSWYQYCISLWMKGDNVTELTLFGRSGRDAAARTVRASSTWRRVSFPVSLSDREEAVRFGVQIGGRQSVRVYGLQVEAQIGPSGYKRTRSRSGVHRRARFGQDVLEVVAEGPNCFGCTVTVVAVE